MQQIIPHGAALHLHTNVLCAAQPRSSDRASLVSPSFGLWCTQKNPMGRMQTTVDWLLKNCRRMDWIERHHCFEILQRTRPDLYWELMGWMSPCEAMEGRAGGRVLTPGTVIPLPLSASCSPSRKRQRGA